MSANRMRNKILSINDEHGNKLEDRDAFKKEVVSFHEKLLGTRFPNRMEAGTIMSDLVIEAEIKAAMFSISGDKAPGLDGFNAAFFQRNWNMVGKILCWPSRLSLL